MLHPKPYLEKRAATKHNKNFHFQTKRDPFPYNTLIRAAPKNKSIFCLDKCLSCYNGEVFGTPGGFFIFST